MEYISKSVQETYEIAEKIRIEYISYKIFLLEGDLGSGKTTFVKGFVEALKCKEDVTSPTFTIVQEYDCRKKIYHIDLYRLHSISEIIDIGIDDYLESGEYVFIEWGDHYKRNINEKYLTIRFYMIDLNTRVINLQESS